MIELLIYFVGVIVSFFLICYYENKSAGYIDRFNMPLFVLFSIFSWFTIFCLFFLFSDVLYRKEDF